MTKILYALFLLGSIFATFFYDAHAGIIPRFVSLRSDETNLRVGPGERYPIKWVYHRAGLPMEVTDEYGHWRKLRDWEGEEGWMHKSLLTSTRSALVIGETRTLRRKPEPDAQPVLQAKPMVVGQIANCTKTWCRLRIQGRYGWLPKEEMWGAYEEEEFED